jgi:glutathione S-transferase
MSITIYQMAHSPFCIPITQALTATGTAFETREIPNWDRSEILRLTGGAYYQVPVLVHDGKVILESGSESQDVARYVDGKFASGALFPERLDGLQAIVNDFLENEVEILTFRLVDIQWIESIEDVAARGMIIRHKERKFGRGCVEQWRKDAQTIRADADRLLERFEITLRHSEFLLGSAPVYADFLLFGILGNLTYRNYNQLNPNQAALGKWMAVMRDFRF